MANDNQRIQVKKNALDNRKLCLFSPAPNNPVGSDRQAILMWNVYANNPRITVFTGDPTDSSEANNKGRISANLDGPVFFAFIEMVERVARSKTPLELKILNKNYSWANNKRSDEPSVVSELHVAKEEDGSIWISVEAEKRPKIKFFIAPSDWHQICYADGRPLEKTEVTALYAMGYCNLLRSLVSGIMLEEYAEPIQRSLDNDYQKMNKVEHSASKLPSNILSDDLPF